MTNIRTTVAVLGSLFTLVASSSAIEFISVPAGTLGNEPGGPGGTAYSWDFNFDVQSPISVTSLGAFDSGSDGSFLSTITVTIFDRTTGTAVSPLLTFSTGDSGYAVGGFRYKDLSVPLSLPAGFRGALVAAGHSGQNTGYEPFANTVHPGGPATAFDDGGGLLSNLGDVSYSSGTTVPVFPGVTSGTWNVPVVAAGSFAYTASGSGTGVADASSTSVLLGMACAALGLIRKKV